MTEQSETSKQLVLCHFEPKDTSEYIKSKVDICAERMIEKFKTHELQFEAKKQLLEDTIMATNLKLEIVEKSQISFQSELQPLCEKFIKDIDELKKYKKYLDKSNFKKEIVEIKLFNKRVNDIITSLQSRLDELENKKSKENILLDKINSLENKLNTQNSKIKQLEHTLEDNKKQSHSQVELLIKKSLENLDLNFIKLNEKRNQDYDGKLNHLINEIDTIKNETISKILQSKVNTVTAKITSSIETSVLKTKNDLTKQFKSFLENKNNNHKKYETMILETIESKIPSNDFLQLKQRISNVEQQIICQMTTIHNMSYNFVPPHQFVNTD